jgi:S-(hydroxymethyl)glutathione dehydrogenase/alcohol dehydrogenase
VTTWQSFVPSCGTCPSCRAGETNLSDLGMSLMSGTAVSDGTFHVQAKGQNVYPYALLGTFAPYFVVHQTSLVKIDPDVPLTSRRSSAAVCNRFRVGDACGRGSAR